MAAATTSLPEVPGGVRNWDYRYCWPRDASLRRSRSSSSAATTKPRPCSDWILDRVGHLPAPSNSARSTRWRATSSFPKRCCPPSTGTLGSRPVRIGNAADQQVQLDVFGPVVELVHRWRCRRAHHRRLWQLVHDMVSAVSRRWHEPDHGIWEERRPQRHHVHSKVMCWLASTAQSRIGRADRAPCARRWPTLRTRSPATSSATAGTPTCTPTPSPTTTPSSTPRSLWIGLSGLLPTTDPRFVATVKAIERDLRKGAIVYRYRLDDGLPGDEGGFLICTAWLIEAYVMMGSSTTPGLLFDALSRLGRAHRLAQRAVRPATESDARQPPPGVLTPRPHQRRSRASMRSRAISRWVDQRLDDRVDVVVDSELAGVSCLRPAAAGAGRPAWSSVQ